MRLAQCDRDNAGKALNWCEEHFGREFRDERWWAFIGCDNFNGITTRAVFEFQNDSDAVEFLLRWS